MIDKKLVWYLTYIFGMDEPAATSLVNELDCHLTFQSQGDAMLKFGSILRLLRNSFDCKAFRSLSLDLQQRLRTAHQNSVNFLHQESDKLCTLARAEGRDPSDSSQRTTQLEALPCIDDDYPADSEAVIDTTAKIDPISSHEPSYLVLDKREDEVLDESACTNIILRAVQLMPSRSLNGDNIAESKELWTIDPISRRRLLKNGLYVKAQQERCQDKMLDFPNNTGFYPDSSALKAIHKKEGVLGQSNLFRPCDDSKVSDLDTDELLVTLNRGDGKSYHTFDFGCDNLWDPGCDTFDAGQGNQDDELASVVISQSILSGEVQCHSPLEEEYISGSEDSNKAIHDRSLDVVHTMLDDIFDDSDVKPYDLVSECKDEVCVLSKMSQSDKPSI